MILTGDNYMSTVTTLVNQVRTRKEAEEVVKQLLQNFSTDAAYGRAEGEARDIKQTVSEVFKRRVTNLFRSLETRRG
jgi:hypothetical protein